MLYRYVITLHNVGKAVQRSTVYSSSRKNDVFGHL